MPLITHANARSMAAKAAIARAARRKSELDRLALIDSLLASHAAAQSAAQDAAALAASIPAPSTALPLPDYQSSRLSRVRDQIDRLSDLLDVCDDPVKLDRLASAIERLSDLERTLDGRPLPGNLRPSAPRQSSASSASIAGGHSPSSNAHRPPPRPIAPTIAPPHDPTAPPSASD